MKTNNAINVLVTALVTGITSTEIDTADTECGSLGVMVDDGTLPEGVDLAQLRDCVDHPLGKEAVDLEPRGHEMTDNPLVERSCVFDAWFGCSSGYCWARCGEQEHGAWCWLAANYGYGGWLTCSSWKNCSPYESCGVASGSQPCSACGCSC